MKNLDWNLSLGQNSVLGGVEILVKKEESPSAQPHLSHLSSGFCTSARPIPRCASRCCIGCDGINYNPEWGIDSFSTCSVEEFYKNNERLERLKMEPLRTLLFQNPKMAVYNELENAELVYTSW